MMPGRPGRLMVRGLWSAGIRVALFPFSAVAMVITAHALPAEERGILALILTVAAMGSQLGGLGISAASAFQVSTGAGSLRVVLGNALIVTALGSLVGFIAVHGLHGVLFSGSLRPVDYWFAISGIPLLLLGMLVQTMMVSIQSTRWYNLIQISQVVLGTTVVAALALLGVGTALPYALASFLATAVVVVIGLVVLIKVASGISVSGSLAWAAAGYGFRSYVCCLLSFAVNRGVLLWVHVTRGDGDLGQFALALALNEIAISAVSVVSSFLFQRMSEIADPHQRELLVLRSLAVTWVGFLALVAMPALLLPDGVFRWVFGPHYPDLPALVRALLPYGLMTCSSSILAAYWCVLGIPPLVVIANAIMALVMVFGAVIWPRMEPQGVSLLLGCSVGVSAMILASCLGRPLANGSATVQSNPRQPDSEV